MEDARSSLAAARMLSLKTAAFVLFYVGAVAVGIPALLLWWADGRLLLGLGGARFVGIVPMVGGLVVYLYCTVHLSGHGRGIPAPFDPTQRLVASGPYAVVRNPMYVAASLYFIGLAILFDSGALLAFALLMTTAYWGGVVLLEEPALVRRFGPAFTEYCKETPRWIPSRRSLATLTSGRTSSRAGREPDDDSRS